MIWITELGVSNFTGRVVILGIGNEMRGDDAAGIEVVKRVKGNVNSSRVLTINAGPVPENFLSKVVEFDPDRILMVDSVDADNNPGDLILVEASDISNPSLSTHSLSLERVVDFLEDSTEAEISFLGIQPKWSEFGLGLSKEVEESVRDLSDYLIELL